jgi:4-hydroxymandelate oxidase
MVGRPIAWGLAAEGEEGVAGVLGILRAEFENAMALAGSREIADIGRDLVAPAP